MIETTEIEGFAAVRLRAGELSATFVPGAGMLGISLRDGDDELLGARHGLDAYVHDARTMGIPLLHPWANRLSRDAFSVAGTDVRIADGAAGLHRDGNGLAIHGLVAGVPDWVVEEAGESAPAGDGAAGDSSAFSATLDFGARPDLLASFPFPHMLRLDVALGERGLRIATTLTATGDVPVPLAYGFHPYLQLAGVPREQWLVELPALERLELDERGIPTGTARPAPAESRPLAERSLDDAYDGVAPGAVFAVSAAGRRLEVHFEQGFPAAQVFAPPSEQLICFEPMTAPTDALVSGRALRLVAPGEQNVSAFAIVVPPLQSA
ncbi:aldose 1-epimerase [Conexibacter stalactiti]|uniref:Aldose 1-epimerase n=1 Tax=Conexibacter stalactiti TaxID=1940611 RepID=A0ABU4HZH0_9ACTN|nr:aldose 1-epimerase [Conexibacter stalactiti]MDW5598726.1 aldose 1-epimerase [Conexibacter stalactiti]MEC5039368.1 aldose 1-epimerase [Conexibacter stalactiti]